LLREIVRELARHERARPVARGQVSLGQQLLVSEQRRGSRDLEIVGKGSRRRQAGAGGEASVGGPPAHSEHGWFFPPFPRSGIDPNEEVSRWGRSVVTSAGRHSRIRIIAPLESSSRWQAVSKNGHRVESAVPRSRGSRPKRSSPAPKNALRSASCT